MTSALGFYFLAVASSSAQRLTGRSLSWPGGRDVNLYPDAEDYIQRALVQQRLRKECEAIRTDPANHPLRKELLNATLLPYQLDGIAFAVGTGRAILADDMELGKTIQGIGVAELLNELAGIRRVLVICPASLKSQWRGEIQRFSGRSVQLVAGNGAERHEQYASDTFFTICNYEQVLRDLTAVEVVPWDLIVRDEGQRIKNWESKTSNVIRSLESPFRLVLSGTPLENNLGELFTVARFVDEQRLGPAFQFFNCHRVVDDRGKTIGYHQLDELRSTIGPILLRRTRGEVAKQLPERTDQIIRVEPTAEQKVQARREKVSSATGQLVTAALSLAGELISQSDDRTVDDARVEQLTERLSKSIDTDAEGRPQLTITLPDKESLRGLATTLARLLG